VATEIAATLAFSAIQNNDKIGVIFFSDKIEKFIPPQKGKKHILYIIRELINFQAESLKTDTGMALKFLTNAIKKRCTTFMISDFINKHDYNNALTIANRKHDIVALQVYDNLETQLPDVGLMKIVDSESGAEKWVDTSSRKVCRIYCDWWTRQQEGIQVLFNRSKVDSVSVRTDEDYVKALMALFKKRR
jgi:uncharacterized protein (DUF58 family)